jgi:hypothetical protein
MGDRTDRRGFDPAVTRHKRYSGKLEIAIRPVSELVNVPGIGFVGPVPEEVQYLSMFSAAIVAGSKQVDAGQRLILPRIGSGRSRDSQEWNGPCEVAIIAALNKFGTLQAQDLDQRDDSFGSTTDCTASTIA